MTQATTKPPTNLQPRLKAAPTFNTSSQTASRSSTPLPQSQPHGIPRTASYASKDYTSDSATLTLIRRTLCARQGHPVKNDGSNGASRPIHELLPPLTSSNAVDLQLYAFIAIIIRDYIQAWYAKITPDQEFVDQVIQIIAHCTRAIEERLKNVDLELLLLDEIPALFENHILAYQTSFQDLHSPALASNPLEIYHAIHPHPALSPVPDPSNPQTSIDQAKNEAAYRHILVQNALAVLLPADDFENEPLRALVGEIFAELILGNAISTKGSEGRLWWEGIIKAVRLLQQQVSPPNIGGSGAAKNRKSDNRPSSKGSPETRGSKSQAKSSVLSSASSLFAACFQYAFMIFSILRFVIVNLCDSSALKARVRFSSTSRSFGTTKKSLKVDSTNSIPPLIALSIFSATSRLFSFSAQTPWVYGSICWVQQMLLRGPLQLGASNSALDRLIHTTLVQPLFSPAHLPTLLVALRSTFFPGNHLARDSSSSPSSSSAAAAPTAPTSNTSTTSTTTTLQAEFEKNGHLNDQKNIENTTVEKGKPRKEGEEEKEEKAKEERRKKDEDEKALRRECALALLSLPFLPPSVAGIYLGTASTDLDAQIAALDTLVLDVVAHPYCLKHFLWAVVELVTVRVLPELAD